MCLAVRYVAEPVPPPALAAGVERRDANGRAMLQMGRFLGALALAWLGMAACVAAADQTWAIDPGRSTATFTVRHFGIFRVSGTIPLRSGTIVADAATGIPASVRATLDPSGIETGIRARDHTLAGRDYFDASTYADITFASTSVETPAGGAFRLLGNLTIHGTTRPIELDGHLTTGAGEPTGYDATAALKRRDFGITAGESVIADDVAIALHIVVMAPH